MSFLRCFGIIFILCYRKLQRHMEDQDAGSNDGVKPSFALNVNGVPEDDNEQDVKDVKKKFNRLDHKSIYTILQISKDPRLVSYYNSQIGIFYLLYFILFKYCLSIKLRPDKQSFLGYILITLPVCPNCLESATTP